jgi:hypothetical protein
MTTFRKYLLLSLILALLNATILVIFFVPRFDHTDTREYVATIKYISGQSGGELSAHRILKPLPILIGAALTSILSAENTLIVQNLVFYFLSVWLIFLLIYRFYQNEKQAFYGTVLYTGAYPMLAYGLAPLTDLSGWFFYLFSVWIALNFLKKPRLETAILSGFVAGFGMLFKENVAAAPIFFASILFLASQLSIKERIKYILAFGVAFLLFPLVNSMAMYKLYSYSYFDWFRAGGFHAAHLGGFYAFSSLRILIEIGRVLLIGWIFVLFGVLKEFAHKNIERIKILLAFIPPSLSFFLWGYPHNRIIYIAAPLLVLIGSFGLLRKYRNTKIITLVELSLVFIYILVNYAALEFFLRYGPILQPPGTLFG